MAEAIWWAAAELEATEAERKILLAVSDGEPNNGPMAADVVQRCGASGFEVCAIGIGTEAVARYFSSSARIDTIEELAPAMFKMLEPMLLQERSAA
jgi:cobalamin biosynthesis protein CobT